MNADLIQDVEVTYRVRVEVRKGMILPDAVKSVSNWTPIRHGVLLNEYMKWSKNHRGSKKEFARYIVQGIDDGLFPLLERNELLDAKMEPVSIQSVMSQIDWWSQEENQVITEEPNSTEKVFHPNNVMILTTKQKAEEAARARAKKEKAQEENNIDDNLASKIASLDPEVKFKLLELLK